MSEVKNNSQFSKEVQEFDLSETNSLFEEDVDKDEPIPFLVNNSEFENSSIVEVKTEIQNRIYKINKAKKDWERKVSMPLLNRIPDKKLAATLKSQTSLKLD